MNAVHQETVDEQIGKHTYSLEFSLIPSPQPLAPSPDPTAPLGETVLLQ